MKHTVLLLAVFGILPALWGAPVPAYGTYFGGSGDEYIIDGTVTAAGEVVIVGVTSSQTLPGTERAFQPRRASGVPNNRDAFIAKFDASGKTLLWATFLGGDGEDLPVAIAVDTAGGIYITGTTASVGFPVRPGAYKTQPVQGQVNSFVSKISANGETLLYSSYLPQIISGALAVNSLGEAFIAAQSFGPSCATTGAVNVGSGICLMRLNAVGSALVYGTDLGGGGFNGSRPTAIVLDSSGNAYVGGTTAQGNTAATANALQNTYSNAGLTNSIGPGALDNGFLIKVNPQGTQVLYGTFFGPRFAGTVIRSLALGSDGALYFSGSTNADSLTPTPGAYQTTPSRGFMAKLTPGLRSLDSFSYLPAIPIVHVANQSQKAYVLLETKMAELVLPSLGEASKGFSFGDLVPITVFSSSPTSVWAIASCGPCSPGSLISSDAYQPRSSGGSDIVLMQLTEVLPTASFIGSSATLTSPFSAGQLITIFGSQMGPKTGLVGQLDAQGSISKSNSTTKVLFDGQAAPILYTRDDQVNTAMPCALAGRLSTQVVVEYMGVTSSPLSLTLAPAAPGIFTLAGSGKGQGAILNQDYSVNGPQNPAAKGSVVMIYATGLGVTSPACIDGMIYGDTLPVATLPVVVGISNIGAQVLYAGQAPGIVSGVAQINAVIPNDSPSGVVSITLRVGDQFSPVGVTIAVK